MLNLPKRLKMKHVCRNCHFLSKEIREENTGRVLNFSVTADEREQVRNGNINFVKDHYCLKCYQGVWDEGVTPGKENRSKIVNDTNRKNKCFYWKYSPGTLFPAAVELQKRKAENEQLKRSNLYTRIGLWIAAIGLILSAITALIKS